MLNFQITEPFSLGLKFRIDLCGSDLSSQNLPAEIENFNLGAVLLLCFVSKQQKPPSSGLKSRMVFGVEAFVPVISSLKEIPLVLVPVFYHA
jgi:hypothetical protein